jgi:hypothetical protein
MTREEFIEEHANSIMEDSKVVWHIVKTTVEDNVNDLSDKEFKEMLIELGYDEEDTNE